MAQHPLLLHINAATAIPKREIWPEFAHASGPGGQNVNNVSSQVTLCFSVANSAALTASQKQRIFAALKNRINKQGILRITCNETRHQSQNRAAALKRLQALLAGALQPRKRRRPTRPSRAAKEKRLRDKRLRAAVKQQRRKPTNWE